MPKKVLFLSNGHGEDVNASVIAQALHQLDPSIQIGAMPTVGNGNAYRQLKIEIIGPTKAEIPSGGFSYANYWLLVADIVDGLVGRLWRQIVAVRRYAQDADLVLAMGDEIVLIIAALTGRPFISFLCSTSAHYEQRLRISRLRHFLLCRSQCQKIYTRDALTAECMQSQGFSQTSFVGNPFMDALMPSGLIISKHLPCIALLPGSRQPEAAANLEILLQLVLTIAQQSSHPIAQYWLALTPNFLVGAPSPLQKCADSWQVLADRLEHPQATVYFSTTAFADILEQTTIVVGMAGTAIEQAVGLGKAVIQIPGQGPQFTYNFAEAQSRLLGESVVTIGQEAATPEILATAAQKIPELLYDSNYLANCQLKGQQRVGGKGAAAQIAQDILATLSKVESK